MLRIATQALKIALVGLCAVAVISGSFWFFDYYRERTSAKDIGQSVIVSIKKTDDVDAVAKKLSKNHLINSETYFKLRFRFVNKDLKPGTYRLTIGMSADDIINAITAEKSAAKATNPELTVTIPEGWRITQIAEAVGKAGLNGGAEAFMEGLKNVDISRYDFLKGVKDRSNPSALEGYLFPDTYKFKADTAPEDLIQLMLDNFDAKVTPKMREQAQAKGMTIAEVLTYASLVEREAAKSEERPIIAQVYLSRIQQGMNLEADPTVQYALGKSGDWWPTLTGDQLFAESPYNTYQHGGLPPTPICNPGLDSILAVLNPSDTNYLFFVAKGDTGEHAFATTIEEQQANIDKYQNNKGG